MSRFILAAVVTLLLIWPLHSEIGATKQRGQDVPMALSELSIGQTLTMRAKPADGATSITRHRSLKSDLRPGLDGSWRNAGCVQLPSACTSNSDCSCSGCCGAWSGNSGICQPSC